MVPSSACEGQLYRRVGVPSVVTCFWRVPSGLVSQMLWLLTYAMLLAPAVAGGSVRASTTSATRRAGRFMTATAGSAP